MVRSIIASVRNFQLFPKLLIVLALLVCQQFAIAHSISHIHHQIEQINHDGHSSDETSCDTCHALGSINHFLLELPYLIHIQENFDIAQNNFFSDYFCIPAARNAVRLCAMNTTYILPLASESAQY